MSRHRSGKRPWLAVALALLYPGAGHIYLREGLRALGWFGLMFVTVVVSLPSTAVPESGGLTFEAIVAASRALPTAANVALVLVSVLSTVDAYRIARRRNPGDATATDEDAERRCPHCGRETDATFEFCQWCGEALDTDGS